MRTGSDKLFVFPGNIEPDILSIAARQVPYARTEAFGSLVLNCESHLLRLLDCHQGRVISLTASGSAAMESVVSNLVGQNDRVLVLNGGTFGQRWVDLVLLRPHASLDVYTWDITPDYEKIESMIRHGNYQLVLMQHHETSTGELIDLAQLGKFCRESGALCVVDAIGSFLADPFSMKEMQVDVAVLSSQKGLCLPPGLAFVALGERALSRSFYTTGLYGDFQKNLDSLKRGQPLFSPAALLFLQLHERLNRIVSADDVIERVASKAHSFRAHLAKDGREMTSRVVSNCLTSFLVDCYAPRLCEQLAKDGWYVMPSKDDDQIRVSHLGMTSELDHEMLYERIVALETSLKND